MTSHKTTRKKSTTLDSAGRFRYCHALFDRRNDADPSIICNTFRDKLFGDPLDSPNGSMKSLNNLRSMAVHTDSYRDDSSDDDKNRFGPAGKSSIEELEEVSDLGPEFDCVICVEEGEKKVKCMPCGHALHGRCIEEWLEKNNLCRYAMPCDS
ncbi:hypothetical protein V6N12_068193 [Hibiscus sabdariffa]|uniref:RING-type E3 ubiquitin transferase n=1 Tax=Hibiscus sabdariffa TaxID=183260 RepID=A0ABR2FQ01_9ROSI